MILTTRFAHCKLRWIRISKFLEGRGWKPRITRAAPRSSDAVTQLIHIWEKLSRRGGMCAGDGVDRGWENESCLPIATLHTAYVWEGVVKRRRKREYLAAGGGVSATALIRNLQRAKTKRVWGKTSKKGGGGKLDSPRTRELSGIDTPVSLQRHHHQLYVHFCTAFHLYFAHSIFLEWCALSWFNVLHILYTTCSDHKYRISFARATSIFTTSSDNFIYHLMIHIIV